MVQGLLNLVSFSIGGVLVGFFSSGRRVPEPAIGAFLSVALVLSLSLFTPSSFIRFSLSKTLFGGVGAFWLGRGPGEAGGNRLHRD